MILRLITLFFCCGLTWGIKKDEVLGFPGLKRGDIKTGDVIHVYSADEHLYYDALVTEILPAGSNVDFRFHPLKPSANQSSPFAPPSTAPGAPVGSDISAGDAQTTMRGQSIGAAVGAGAAAGVAHGVIGGIYQAFVMTPARERELARAMKEQRAAEASRDHAVDELSQLRAKNDSLSAAVRKRITRTMARPVAEGNIPDAELATGDPAFDVPAMVVANKIRGGVTRTSRDQRLSRLGFSALGAGRDAHRAGQFAISESALKLATTIADLVVGLDPVSGTVRFGYELVSGKNMITGKELNTFERSLAGVIFTTSLITFGMSATLVDSLRLGGAMLEKTPAGAKALGELASTLEQLKQMGWGPRSMTDFATFTREVLSNQIQNLKYAIAAAETWSKEARATFPEMLRQMNGSAVEMEALAKELGLEVNVLKERRAMAIGFYNNAPPGFFKNSLKIDNKLTIISDHLRGIDFTKELNVLKLPEGTPLLSWKHPQKDLGNYFVLTRTEAAGRRSGSFVKNERW